MFDWPEPSQTSPTNTSWNTTFSSAQLIVISCGDPFASISSRRQRPRAVRPYAGGLRLTVEADRHGAVWHTHTPDRNLCLTLEHHVVTEDGGDPETGGLPHSFPDLLETPGDEHLAVTVPVPSSLP